MSSAASCGSGSESEVSTVTTMVGLLLPGQDGSDLGSDTGDDSRREHGRTALILEESSEFFKIDGYTIVVEELLGSGSFGSVFKCKTQQTRPPSDDEDDLPETVAVKVIDAKRIAVLTGYPLELVRPRLLREVEVLQHLGMHPHILKLYMTLSSEESGRLYLVTELVQGGDLFQLIVQRRRPFTEKEVRVIFSQIVDAVSFCHEQGVAHRDVKLENVLIQDDQQMNVVLCDYGQAKVIHTQDGITDTAQTLTTSPSYTAPEVQQAVDRGQSYDAFKADAFGLGVVLYRMLCNVLPNAGKDEKYERHKMWASLSNNAKNLIQQLLAPDPQKRIAAMDIHKHDWIACGIYDPPAPSNSGQPATLKGSSPSSLSPVARLETDALQRIQKLIVAAQRERATCCWALCSPDADRDYAWHGKATDDRCSELLEIVDSMMKKSCSEAASGGYPSNVDAKDDVVEKDHKAGWQRFRQQLQDIQMQLVPFRQKCRASVEQREETLEVEEDFWDVFHGYSTMISNCMAGLFDILKTILDDSDRQGPSLKVLNLHITFLSAEQLARERAYICGHLDRPETLRLSSVVMELSRIIGARQLLLGSLSKEGRRGGSVVCAEFGLLVALQLADTPALTAEDLDVLETAEARIMNSKRGRAPAAAEVYHILTDVIEKVHGHASVLLSYVLARSS